MTSTQIGAVVALGIIALVVIFLFAVPGEPDPYEEGLRRGCATAQAAYNPDLDVDECVRKGLR